MLPVDEREQIRRAYYVEHKPKRQIARELGHARTTVDKALRDAAAAEYHLSQPRTAPVLGPVKAQVDAWLVENETLPRNPRKQRARAGQRYTSHVIFKKLQAEHGFTGGESTIRGYISRERQRHQRPAVFLPLEFDPGQDAQVDWGEAEVELAGERRTVQLFVLRLCYSRRLFVMAFPTQKQESFFEGHVQAFHVLGGVPHTLTYDNLGSAVTRVLLGREREVNPRFIAFRSHYLFASRFCTPGEGHEKGGVEHGVGYARRNLPMSLAVGQGGPVRWRAVRPLRRLRRSTRTCAPPVKPMNNASPMAGHGRSEPPSPRKHLTCRSCPTVTLAAASAYRWR